jgi:hypothetical protein
MPRPSTPPIPDHGLHPTVQAEIPLGRAVDGFRAVWQGEVRGKVVLVP